MHAKGMKNKLSGVHYLKPKDFVKNGRPMIRAVPTIIVIAHTFCASRDTPVSYR